MMNERIEQIANQAGMSRDKFGLYFDTRDHDEGVDLEKFAELIVRECQFAIVSRTDLPRHERKLYNNVLKEHFGVE
jgi:hypothetical protein